MIRVLAPSPNRITQEYSTTHKAYDFSGIGDPSAHASFSGVVVESKNDETGNWINSGKLTTRDYGNYCKVKGNNLICIYAHLEPGSVLPTGSNVTEGQVIGKIGNTGNSTGKHLHAEYRSLENVNTPVEFVDNVSPVPSPLIITDQTRIPQISNMEVQAIRSVMFDQERAISTLTMERNDALQKLADIKPLGTFARLGALIDDALAGNHGKKIQS